MKKMIDTDAIYDTARTFYLAGLGVVATANEEVRTTYSKLVKKGETFEKDADNPMARATGTVKEFARGAEDRVQKTVGTALNRAGVPNRDEIRTLIDRVEDLTKKVDRIAEAQ